MNYEAKTLIMFENNRKDLHNKMISLCIFRKKLLGVYLDAVVDKDVSVEIKCSLLEGVMQQTRTTLSLLDIYNEN